MCVSNTFSYCAWSKDVIIPKKINDRISKNKAKYLLYNFGNNGRKTHFIKN